VIWRRSNAEQPLRANCNRLYDRQSNNQSRLNRYKIFTSRAPKRRLVRRAGRSPMHLSLTDVVAKALGELWQLSRFVVLEPVGKSFV